eukprot:scaffold4849_cov153-Amphora_coffeaeformis.AAC.4
MGTGSVEQMRRQLRKCRSDLNFSSRTFQTMGNPMVDAGTIDTRTINKANHPRPQPHFPQPTGMDDSKLFLPVCAKKGLGHYNNWRNDTFNYTMYTKLFIVCRRSKLCASPSRTFGLVIPTKRRPFWNGYKSPALGSHCRTTANIGRKF